MLKSIDARLEKLEKELGKESGPASLSDLECGHLSSEIILINYVTPYSGIHCPLMNKYRKRWGQDIWTKYLMTSVANYGQTCTSDWWKALDNKQQYYLIHGKEIE